MTVATPRALLRAMTGVLVVVLVAAAAPSAGAGSDDKADALMEGARKIAIDDAFSGLVEVYWQDEEHQEFVDHVGARGLGGAFAIGQAGRQVVGSGDDRQIGAGGAGVGWTAAAEHEAPAPDAAWDLEVTGSGVVAGRPATFVEARDDNGRARAIFAVDKERGQLLERQILDRDGNVVRSVGFLRISTGAFEPYVPAVPDADTPAPVAIDDVPDGFVAPASTDSGYELLGRYRHADGSTHLFYSDGLFTLSVFEQKGAVDWDRLPAGRCEPIDDLRTCSYDTAVGTIVVWNQQGIVFTAIGDAPPDLVVGVVGHFDDAGSGSWLDDVANFVLDPFGWD
jgi:hypothetical protein